MPTFSVGGPCGGVTTSIAVAPVGKSTCATPVFVDTKVYGEAVLTPQVALTATGSTTAHMAAFASKNPEG